ncbi:DNA recombination protein RmuC [Pseudoroseomonas wenyumeiae]|uniref:DNA recombination protein RmuC homolog n=1 Tax=Teichococcus wenyumeiae TaxID=2478470 RepID=A0A3A9J6K7_9PROT|nr:DNA recombination protein RmuC [Pseudoroseomonas wenyumeiae]RKK02857.1 DNA recombination protein RmuC [Pseudoroseomonas wenyumeiae]RMI27031.1 DNA recombination protein RmuC [Pseudoroseomonas wenyumeiae]
MSETMLLVAVAALGVLVLLLAVAALRRPAGADPTEAFALLAGKLEAVAATQERLAGSTLDRLAQQDRALAERLESGARRMDEALAAQNRRMAEDRLASADRLAQVAESLNGAIAAQNQRLDAALAGQGEKLSRTLAEQAQRAQETAGQIHERLAVIDAARQNMEALGTQVGTLASILGNKQSRGAFGEMQLRQLIEDRLPPEGFSWQHVLSNGTRCDCLIRLPHPPGPVVVDSKFPLEAWQALRDAGEDVGARTAAARQFSADMRRHVDDISKKYLIAGETAEAAILFVPSEAVFAELHTGFAAVVDEAQRRRVYVASPTTLWAMLSAMRALMQDVRMRAQAGRIQEEVGRLVEDVSRLNARVGGLKRHFDQAQDDIRQIEISTDKIVRRGGRIESVELEDAALPAPAGESGGPASLAG